MDVRFSEKYMSWEGTQNSMKYKNTITDRNTTQLVYHLAIEPPILQEAEERHDRILDADYSAVNVPEYANKLTHLNNDQKSLLLDVLNDHTSLFRGGLGTLK
jgi:hypothetical protein